MSNKTPNEPADATESERKSRFIWLLVATVLLIGGFWLLVNRSTDGLLTIKTPNGQKLKLEVANTTDARQQGLSGRDKLDGAMLFVLDKPSEENCMWMKDMKFPIDVVWLDESKKVIDVRSNVRPETYPKTFCPRKPAKYFIELNAKTARDVGLRNGEQVKF